MMGDYVLERHEHRPARLRLIELDEARQDLGRHLHPREDRLVRERIAHEHGQAQRQV